MMNVIVVCRVTTIGLFSAVILQRVDLAAAAADDIVTREMIAVGHGLPVVATSVTATTGAVTVATDTLVDTGAATDVTRAAGHRQNQRTSRSS